MSDITLSDVLEEKRIQTLTNKIGLNYKYEQMDVDYLIYMEPYITQMNQDFLINV